MKQCRTSGPAYKFTLCTDSGDIYRFNNSFTNPNYNEIIMFYGTVTQSSPNDYIVVDGALSTLRASGGDPNFDNSYVNDTSKTYQNFNGVATSGELFKYDVQLTTSGVGLGWELTDYSTGDTYIIQGGEVSNKAEELLMNSPKFYNNQNNGTRSSGESTYYFSGKVKDQDGIINSPNTYLITSVDMFEIK